MSGYKSKVTLESQGMTISFLHFIIIIKDQKKNLFIKDNIVVPLEGFRNKIIGLETFQLLLTLKSKMEIRLKTLD